MDVLTIKELKKSFGEKPVLRGLSLAVPEHSIFGFVGRNGAGKTTTMKAVLGLLSPDAGEITVLGEKVTFGATPTNRHIGYLPDVPEFYPFMTAREYLTLCGEIRGMKKSEIKGTCDELLSLVGLADEKQRIRGYSRGMKQRLGIASALLGEPSLLICDEPTSALDPLGRKEILDVLLAVKERTTVLFSTHILSDVERICSDAALLDGGKIARAGKIGELLSPTTERKFTVTLSEHASPSALTQAFPSAKLLANGTLLFEGDDDMMFAVHRFIADKGLSLVKMERTERTLEALFAEVVKK